MLSNLGDPGGPFLRSSPGKKLLKERKAVLIMSSYLHALFARPSG